MCLPHQTQQFPLVHHDVLICINSVHACIQHPFITAFLKVQELTPCSLIAGAPAPQPAALPPVGEVLIQAASIKVVEDEVQAARERARQANENGEELPEPSIWDYDCTEDNGDTKWSLSEATMKLLQQDNELSNLVNDVRPCTGEITAECMEEGKTWLKGLSSEAVVTAVFAEVQKVELPSRKVNTTDLFNAIELAGGPGKVRPVSCVHIYTNPQSRKQELLLVTYMIPEHE